MYKQKLEFVIYILSMSKQLLLLQIYCPPINIKHFVKYYHTQERGRGNQRKDDMWTFLRRGLKNKKDDIIC